MTSSMGVTRRTIRVMGEKDNDQFEVHGQRGKGQMVVALKVVRRILVERKKTTEVKVKAM